MIFIIVIENDTVSEYDASCLTYLLSMTIFGATDIRKINKQQVDKQTNR